MPFSEIQGQDACLSLLKRSLSTGKTAHSYLFEGIEGCGKRKTAVAFVEALFCGGIEGCGVCPSCRKVARLQHPDLHLLEPDGEQIKIDQVRQLQRELALRPFEAPRKACIIDRAERLNPSAGNALLKTLEEPPGSALIILVTAQPGAVLPTIVSRCQQLHFPGLPQEIIERFLLDSGHAAETARLASSLAGGSIGKALQISGEEVLSSRKALLERIDSLSCRDIGPLFAAAEELAAEKEKIPEILDLLVAYLRDILLLQADNRDIVNCDLLPLLERSVTRWSPNEVMQRLDHLLETRHALKRNANPRLALEVLFMRLAQ